MSYTVAELIEKLKLYPPDALVVVDGYEGGLSNLIIRHTRVTHIDDRGAFSKYLFGEWEVDAEGIEAVVLGRDS